MRNDRIDIFLPWVDGSDPKWLAQKNQYVTTYGEAERVYAAMDRYRPGISLRYWFRAVERYLPWVHRIFFITWGHLPDFLRADHPKLRIVRHEDYIPKEYLPTFNSNTIEMNLFRIAELSENILLFNDDLFPLRSIKESYFFRENKVCDEVIERILAPRLLRDEFNLVWHFQANNMAIINKHFDKREIQKKNFTKWFNLRYGKDIWRNIALSYFYDFDYFTNRHLVSAFKKSTFEKVWEKEGKLCDAASKNQFRSSTDVSHYLVRAWQLCEGNFYPRKTVGKSLLLTDGNAREIEKMILRRQYPLLCINDTLAITNYSETIASLERAFEQILPEKSSFER